MTDETSPVAKPPGIKVAPGSSELAPFIYCDAVVTFGTLNGVIQIELIANTIIPEGIGIRTDAVVTAHLRCSPTAARGIMDSIEKALAMPQQQTMEPTPESKPN